MISDQRAQVEAAAEAYADDDSIDSREAHFVRVGFLEGAEFGARLERERATGVVDSYEREISLLRGSMLCASFSPHRHTMTLEANKVRDARIAPYMGE